MNATLPENTVVATSWAEGNLLNYLAGVKTVTDPDHYIPHWVYLYYRYVFCAQSQREALEFLKTHEATHLMLMGHDVIAHSLNNSTIGSNANNDRQFDIYPLWRVETPIGTPYRMRPQTTNVPLAFIDIARASPETLSITAQFSDQKQVETTVDTPTAEISVSIENGGLLLNFDAETQIRGAYYVPPLGWNSLAVRLFYRGELSNIFVPIYPTDATSASDLKIWEIHYPPDIKTDKKYLATQPRATQ
ncbi:hypothetical protein F4054_12695 [Candidatus Poribacteria bacterium]|nr:hypothetical protein [Candidatus Poribacteria bacterium]MYG07681.1 hypothetical protein [Candidatus Poribacteria bacterium]MYK23100.1 hypothetical protein [Candidatus Poribacteria bacterium]